ncbi:MULTISPECIES: MFS transporter [Olivibacter]|jgi:DHA3 family macrolide efflux protein-like MFS transporter|uniref:MFS transporter n=1 Tax=Olivibacter oleidegradans TaxID=760123 RepID=A0ABV6HNG6_9SPHI|nr:MULTISPECIES: MFS transporter [unclassified Olivibacter]MDM8173364.1 MFS transporter [Olivibacter sp. 47]MDX3915201.1 MFS transporter [Pseudosphingobacterium sp.]QEL03137.1 MFS transporter [Olivibacter sp. LS-1]
MEISWKRKFLVIWTGQFISLLSSSAVNFAVIIWLSIETGSAEVLAYAAIAGLLPQALIGPFAGVFIDRWDRKKTMIFADGFISICTIAMSLLFYAGHFELIYIYLLLGLRSAGSAFHMPAMQASVPLLAPESQLLRIAGINQIIQSVSNIAGPALGAFAIGLLDIGHVLLLDVVGAFIAILSLLFIRIPNPAQQILDKASIEQVGRDIVIGVRAVTKNRGLSYLFLFSILATFCIMPVAVLFPLLTLQHFGGGKFEMSLIEVVWGIGMLVGGGLLGVFKPNASKVILINYMHILLGLSLAISGMLPMNGFIFFAILTAIGGVAASIYNASFTTIIQEEIDPAMMGRVFSMFYSIAILPSVIGLLSTGFIADYIGIGRTFFILGGAIVLIGLISFTVSPLMALGRRKERSEVEQDEIN